MQKLASLISAEKLAVLKVLASGTPNGPILEVGVFMGGSAVVLNEIATKQGRDLYLCDTFTGIPYKSEADSHNIGDFENGLTPEETKALFPQAIVQQCRFPVGANVPEGISFVHLDVDQERSYREALDFLASRMKPGGMILCDDYCLAGAKKAIDETAGIKSQLIDGRMLFHF